MQRLLSVLQNLGRSIVSNDLARAMILAGLRHALTAGGALLAAHGVSLGKTDPNSLYEFIAGAILVALTQYFSQADVKGVDAKVKGS